MREKTPDERADTLLVLVIFVASMAVFLAELWWSR